MNDIFGIVQVEGEGEVIWTKLKRTAAFYSWPLPLDHLVFSYSFPLLPYENKMASPKLSTHFLFTNNSGSLSWKTNTDHEIDASNKSQLINLFTISLYHLLLNHFYLLLLIHLITINNGSLSNKQTNTDHRIDTSNKSQLINLFSISYYHLLLTQ